MDSSTWYTVDNVSKVFLASYNKRDPRSFRITVALKEEINPDILQKAVDQAAAERPHYQVLIRLGLFWHYMEATDMKVKVGEDDKRPCPTLYESDRRKKLHYRVTYYGNRINLDMFQGLTYGTGGMQFMNIILEKYFKLYYPGHVYRLGCRCLG